jgi:hypothetical protein
LLSKAITAVLSAKFAVVYFREVCRSAVYSMYNNGFGTLPLGTPTLTVKCT